MPTGQSEAFSRILIDKALEASGWNLLDPQQAQFEYNTAHGRADYLLKDSLGRVLCVLEAKREDIDPYDAKEQARGYAENLNAPFVILSNGREHWFWNYARADQRDAYRIERLPSRDDLQRVRLKNLQPPRPLQTDVIRPEYLRTLRPDLILRAYQIRAMDEIAKGYDDAGRRTFLLEMATGTGKTLLCAALIRRFLITRNAERVLFIVDRIELARQTMEDFNVVLGEFKPVIYKTARRSIYGDAREVVQFFQATRIGLTATPRAYLKNVNPEQLATEDPKALEARQLRDTYHYFGCEPGQPTYRYDISDAVQDPEGPFLCLPKIIDCRSDITTQALQEAGWTVVINEQEEHFKIQDLERKIFTPHRNHVMCEAFLREAQRDPTGEIGKSIVFAVNQTHATALTKILNEIKPGIGLTITSRIPDASSLAKEFRDGQRPERIAVSVDMLSTGYNCRDLLNVVLMRPIFSPTEYIQIKGRGTRRFTFVVGNTEYEKRYFFLLDFCAVAEYFEEQYDYAAPLKVPQPHGRRSAPARYEPEDGGGSLREHESTYDGRDSDERRREIPVWEGTDRIVSQEVRIVGPNGEKVDVMTFRGSFERDLQEFAEIDPDLKQAVEAEDDDAIETILQERFYHRPEMFYAPDKLIASYGVPAPTPAFVYNALGKYPLPTKDRIVADTVDSIAARFNLRYGDQKWLNATAELVSEDAQALADFLGGRYHHLFERSQFRTLGGLSALARFQERDDVFEALRHSSLVQCSRHSLQVAV